MKMGFSSSFLCYDMDCVESAMCDERFLYSFIYIELIKCFEDESRHGCFVRLKTENGKKYQINYSKSR